MSLRIVQVTLPAERKKTLINIADRFDAVDIWWQPGNEDGNRTVSILCDHNSQQTILDSIQTHLSDCDGWRAVLLPVEAVLPKPKEAEKKDEKKKKYITRRSLTREELYQEVAQGAEGDLLFYIMVFLSTIVASIGLLQDSVAIVIAAMVIAPLLAPNLALAFAAAIGDRKLLLNAFVTCFGGLTAAILPCIAVGFFLNGGATESEELMTRTMVDFAAIALALASGAAAVLSMTTGVASALVGVMVSVALLPPAAAFGIFIGLGQSQNVINSGLLLLTNVVCVGLSSQIVFALMGIRPRTWYEKKAASQSSRVQAIVWAILLAVISIIITLKKPEIVEEVIPDLPITQEE